MEQKAYIIRYMQSMIIIPYPLILVQSISNMVIKS